MSELARSDDLIGKANDAGIKLNIFMTGMIATFSAFFVQQFEPDIIGFNSYTIEVYGFILILLSLLFSFLVVESFIDSMGYNGNLIATQYTLSIYSNKESKSKIFDPDSGEIISKDDAEKRIPMQKTKKD